MFEENPISQQSFITRKTNRPTSDLEQTLTIPVTQNSLYTDFFYLLFALHFFWCELKIRISKNKIFIFVMKLHKHLQNTQKLYFFLCFIFSVSVIRGVVGYFNKNEFYLINSNIIFL